MHPLFFNNTFPQQAKNNVRGGDDDLPARPSLAARRAKTDVLRARQAAGQDSDEEAPTLVGKRSRGEEDEFYQVCNACATGQGTSLAP